MPYIRNIFSAGIALTSQSLNQIMENIHLARISHKSNDEPREIQAGVMWLDDTADPWEWKIYTGTEWLTIAKIDAANAAAWTLEGEKATDANQPTIGTSGIQVTTSIVQSTWESVGPTGSGADNIWADMDSLPLIVDWIQVKTISDIRNTIGPAAEFKLWTRKTGSSEGANLATNVVHAQIRIPTITNVEVEQANMIYIPLDTANRFDLQWQAVAGNTQSCNMLLVGYGFNR